MITTPDPTSYDVVSGGSIDASSLGNGCGGFIADAADFEFSSDAGFLDFYVSIQASEDTALVINTPDGNWICDDDSGGGLDSSIHFNNPDDGVYDVWIGAYSSKNTYHAILHISELGAYSN